MFVGDDEEEPFPACVVAHDRDPCGAAVLDRRRRRFGLATSGWDWAVHADWADVEPLGQYRAWLASPCQTGVLPQTT